MNPQTDSDCGSKKQNSGPPQNHRPRSASSGRPSILVAYPAWPVRVLGSQRSQSSPGTESFSFQVGSGSPHQGSQPSAVAHVFFKAYCKSVCVKGSCVNRGTRQLNKLHIVWPSPIFARHNEAASQRRALARYIYRYDGSSSPATMESPYG